MIDIHGKSDEEILELESKACFDFFWQEANAGEGSDGYGLIRDRAPNNPNVASIASVGFGLSAIVIGAERGWVSKQEATTEHLELSILYSTMLRI